MSQWVMRQWFDPQKDADKPWYRTDITEETVLDYLQDRPGGFRLSVPQLKSFWFSIRVLQRRMSLPQMDADLEAMEKELPWLKTLPANDNAKPLPKSGYTSGEIPLYEVGKVFDMSAAAVGVIAQTATAKLGTLTENCHPSALTHDDMEDMEERLQEALDSASKLFALLLTQSNGNVALFLQALVKLHVLTKRELQAVEAIELETLERLSNLPLDHIEEVVCEDLHNIDGNVIKTFQSLYSRFVYHRDNLESKLGSKLTQHLQGQSKYAA